MLRFLKGSYRRSDIELLYELVSDARDRIRCRATICQECDSYKVCHDLNQLSKHLYEHLRSNEGGDAK